MSFQQLDSERKLLGGAAMENTKVGLTVAFGEKVVDLSDTVVFFSSTLVGTGNIVTGSSVDDIAIEFISFRSQWFGNNDVSIVTNKKRCKFPK